MSRFLLDTDTLSLYQTRHPTVLTRAAAVPSGDVELPVVSLQEQSQGWLALLNQARTPAQLEAAYDLMRVRLLPAWSHFPVVPFTTSALARFEQLRSLRLNVGSMDLRIAATALDRGLTVVTRNRRDFGRVPGLPIIDWSV